MYCPKCKQSFEEGSRRFCPTDGARLISEESPVRPVAGVFANLIPKIEPVDEFDETLSDLPHFVVTDEEPQFSAPPVEIDDNVFFELDELDEDTLRDEDFFRPAPVVEPEPVLELELPSPPLPVPPKATRKVSPFEIPAGHVDLGDQDRQSPFRLDFDSQDPESFVGRIVKGRYRVTEFLGGDESGLAYLADDKLSSDKLVLVRILLEDPADDIIGSILAEERVSLSHFSHPNVARVIDSGQFADGTEFLVSEYVDALSVADILAIHGQFGEERTARVIRQAANALSEAHQEGILHRDLRPENIILDNSQGDAEQVKLVNFGASDGTPTPQNFAYKSPEVLEGRIATVASDVFSLAVVAYEMLTGKLPFEGTTMKEVIRSQNSGDAALPSELRPELSVEVDDVLSKAMSYTGADRYTKARDFGDALYIALTEIPKPVPVDEITPLEVVPIEVPKEAKVSIQPKGERAPISKKIEILAPEAPKVAEPAWKNRSPEPPTVESSRLKILAGVGIIALLTMFGLGWYYLANRPEPVDVPSQVEKTAIVPDSNAANKVASTEMPPLPRTITQPPNSNFFQNSKTNLKGDLIRNFVGFSLYYPSDWKVNPPQQGTGPNVRGKFIDMARLTPDGRMQEQMLVSYYPSKGTYADDAAKFPEMAKETNETLKKILPGYQVVSEGEIKLNGDWRAYEIKFQGSGTSGSGEKLFVWGRRLFMPAARPGVRNGFEITMLATSLSEDVHGVDDVGVRGQLGGILYTFEPSQNF